MCEDAKLARTGDTQSFGAVSSKTVSMTEIVRALVSFAQACESGAPTSVEFVSLKLERKRQAGTKNKGKKTVNGIGKWHPNRVTRQGRYP